MDVERNVLIVDDADAVRGDIKQYYSIFAKMKNANGYKYNINFHHVKLYSEAIEYLSSPDRVVDVLVTDYNLATAGNDKNGIQLVEQVRASINKHCKIIFYTMNDISALFEKEDELVQLLNAGIYRFIPKHYVSKSGYEYGPDYLQLRVENIVDAINNIDLIQVTLEKYFMDFAELVEEERIRIDGEDHLITEVIDSIRRDTELGRKYKRNLLESVIIHNISGGKY